jgi:hypothetical protein
VLDGRGRDHPEGNPHAPNNRSMFGRDRSEEEVPFHCAAIPKLSFPQFNGEKMCIWFE